MTWYQKSYLLAPLPWTNQYLNRSQILVAINFILILSLNGTKGINKQLTYGRRLASAPLRWKIWAWLPGNMLNLKCIFYSPSRWRCRSWQACSSTSLSQLSRSIQPGSSNQRHSAKSFTIAVTAYSHFICIWVEWSKELWRICSELSSPLSWLGLKPQHVIRRRMPYPLGHSNYVYWKNLKSNMRKKYITGLHDILNL